MKKRLEYFFDSYIFIIVTFLIAILNWTLGVYFIAMPYYILVIILIITLNLKRINIVTILFAAIISFSFTSMKENAILVAIGGICLLPFVIFDIIKQKSDLKSPVLIGMVLVLLSILCSVRFSINASYALIGIAQYIGYLVVFAYALIVTKGDKEANQNYIAKNMVMLGLAIAIELVIYGLRFGDLSFIENKDIQLGWGFANSIAFIYLIIIFATLYLYLADQKKWYLLLFLILYIYLIIIMQARSVWGIGAIIAIPTIAWLIYKSKNRKKISLVMLSISLLVALLGLSLMLFTDFFIAIDARFEGGDLLNLEDRLPIYTTGIEVFLKFPIYGAGVFTSSYYLNPSGLSVAPTYQLLNNYHNYVIHTLATTGLVGLCAFLYWIRSIFKSLYRKNDFNTIVFFILVCMLLNGLVSTTFYEPVIMLIMFVIWASVSANDKKNLKANDLTNYQIHL